MLQKAGIRPARSGGRYGERGHKLRLRRRPGAFVAFIDSFTEETFLRVECSTADQDLITYHLYDRNGALVADSGGPHPFPVGVEVSDSEGEVLLSVPSEREHSLVYRIYSTKGVLVTASDGMRTEIFGGLRLEGNRPLSGRPPATSKP